MGNDLFYPILHCAPAARSTWQGWCRMTDPSFKEFTVELSPFLINKIWKRIKGNCKSKNSERRHEHLSKVFYIGHLSSLPIEMVRAYIPLNVVVVIVMPCVFFIASAISMWFFGFFSLFQQHMPFGKYWLCCILGGFQCWG